MDSYTPIKNPFMLKAGIECGNQYTCNLDCRSECDDGAKLLKIREDNIQAKLAAEKPEAMKFDKADMKTRLDLIAPVTMAYVGKVCAYGAIKYGEGNCEQGFHYSRLIGAAKRHIDAFQICENNDIESNLPHLAHAIWNLIRLLDQHARHYGTDDRICGIADMETTYDGIGSDMKIPPRRDEDGNRA